MNVVHYKYKCNRKVKLSVRVHPEFIKLLSRLEKEMALRNRKANKSQAVEACFRYAKYADDRDYDVLSVG